jgi:aspartyl-tRNA(Asn)/glutamyl-tRNA(Gln) amidotransferase subunit A
MPVTTDVLFLSAREQGALIRAKKLSPVELTDAYLARIESLNPRTNAFITVTGEVARRQAAEAEREIARGRYRGPLHGIPYAPKDILATKGILTTNGSKVTATIVPDYESTITDRLARAGAVLAGKLNLLEFAMGSGVVSGFGPSRNPWDLTRSPAGSSSGSGTALAAAMVPLSIGTDTGGSIRGPANFCGIVGLKQTYGRVSRYGVTTLAWSLDHAGPMTRTVADAALMLQAIAGHDPLDPSTTADPVPDYSRALTGDIRGVRVGVPARFFADGLAPEIDRAYRAALKTMQGLGAALVDVDVPHAEYATNAGWIVAMAEAAAFHEQRLATSPQLFDPIVRERLDAARFYPATDYIKAQRVRTLLMQEMATVFTLCDVMAVPGGAALPGLLEPPDAAGTDVKPGSKASRFRGGTTFLGNMTGLPALVLPCGFSTGPPALPIGLQLYGRAFDEASIFRVGHAYEQATDWHKRRPPLGQTA